MGVIANLRRSALGASGVALLLPVGLALGVALTTALGGTYQLHALLQVFNGPSVPNANGRPTAPGLEAANQVPDIPPIPRAGRHSSHGGGTRGPVGAPRRPRPSPSVPVRDDAGRGGATHGGSGGGGNGSGGSGGNGGGAGGAGGSPPAPARTPVHDAGQGVADTAKTLPEPVGSTAGGAVQTVVDLIP